MGSPELKYFDTIFSTSASYGGGATEFATGIFNPSFGWISTVTQGVQGNQRLADDVSARSLQYRLSIAFDTTAPIQQYIRLVIFADNECEGAIPSVSQLMQNPTIAGGLMESPLNPGYFGRWKIIHDEVYRSHIGGNEMEKSNVIVGYHDLHNHKIMWTPPTGDLIANALKGHLFVQVYYYNATVAVGSATIGTATPPVVQGIFRLRFEDA